MKLGASQESQNWTKMKQQRGYSLAYRISSSERCPLNKTALLSKHL